MLERVKQYIEKWHMLTSEDKVIIGISGGADSVCLVLILAELQKEIGFEMVGVHVNHGFRKEAADRDAVFTEKLCQRCGILCETYFENVELIAKKRKQSTEEAGREVRREFFAKAMQKHKGTKIALAHHQDDSAETMLIHLARGTGLRGLGGIAPVKGNVIRPLLCVRRKEIEKFLQAREEAYCIDDTNASDQYTRNRIRNHVLPYLEEQINPRAVEHMNETMEQIRQVQELLDTWTEQAWTTCVTQEVQGCCVDGKLYTTLPEVIKPLLLKRVLARIATCEKDLEAIHIAKLQELFGKQSGRKIDLPYGMEAKRNYQGIVVYKKADLCKEIPEEVICDLSQEEANFSWGNKTITCKIRSADSFEKNGAEMFNCDIIKGNISFRTRREGDYITIHPDGRTQKLKSYLINEKIPQEQRDKLLLVAEGNHVLWIVGLRKSSAYQVHEDTRKILEINVYEGEQNGRDN